MDVKLGHVSYVTSLIIFESKIRDQKWKNLKSNFNSTLQIIRTWSIFLSFNGCHYPFKKQLHVSSNKHFSQNLNLYFDIYQSLTYLLTVKPKKNAMATFLLIESQKASYVIFIVRLPTCSYFSYLNTNNEIFNESMTRELYTG